jgi:rhomboid protease GluP
MKVPVVHLRHDRERMPGRWPIATVSVLAVTAVLTVLQFPFPQVRLDLWRDPDALAAGQWWRLVTPLLVQYDAVWQIVVVFACIAGLGALAERVYGHGRWLLLYFGCGVVGQAFGYLWAPPDAGASVAAAGLLGAVCAWLLSPAGPRQAQVRVWGVAWPLGGSCSPPGARCTARRCWSASALARCCCGATGAATRTIGSSPRPGRCRGREPPPPCTTRSPWPWWPISRRGWARPCRSRPAAARAAAAAWRAGTRPSRDAPR